ncbi:hypothetical protein MNBD_BACTEROID03-945 [hydrothermal vent metagenome]|uniref:Uncharacterized protein n=1 Tax=hydrothermal vent metagenome TaxID=652676 RepID=A0A3B0T2M7_9ZZZZ
MDSPPENPPAIAEDEVQELLMIDDFVYQQGKYMEDRSMYRLYLMKEGGALHKKIIVFSSKTKPPMKSLYNPASVGVLNSYTILTRK